MRLGDACRFQLLLVLLGNKRLDRHGLENAQVIGSPASDADEKNPLSLCI